MKKTIILFLSIFMIISINRVNAIEVSSNNDNIDFSMTVEKKSFGWHITTTLVNNGDWIYVEKEGYGDIGCIIYNENDEAVWWTYAPEEGGSFQIGPGAQYESFTIWTGTDMDKNKVDSGYYKIVGASGYYEGNTYIPLRTDPYTIQVKSKEKMFFENPIINKILSYLQLNKIIF